MFLDTTMCTHNYNTPYVRCVNHKPATEVILAGLKPFIFTVHAQRGISQIDHTHSCVMRYNTLVYSYPSASPRDNRKPVGYIGA